MVIAAVGTRGDVEPLLVVADAFGIAFSAKNVLVPQTEELDLSLMQPAFAVTGSFIPMRRRTVNKLFRKTP